MKPKEKAIQIYNNYRNIAPVLEANFRSKKHAIILANEMISELFDLPRTNSNIERTHYWRLVKEELEKL